jgi:prolipoprotein diacylglyceryltransferase
VLAQAIGRLGNYFNQELFGRPPTCPGRWRSTRRTARRAPSGSRPTTRPSSTSSFWDVGVAALVIWADRRFRLGHGRAFALYVAAYTVGRAWIEALRVDPAHSFLGLRLNDWTSLLVFLGAVVYFVVSARLRPGRETPEELEALRVDHVPGDSASDDTGSDDTASDDAAADDTAPDDTPPARSIEDEVR